LLDLLADVPGDFRIRLSSLEAAEARDDLAGAMARHPRVTPHLHLCLQSGSDRILARMKRRYRSRGFLERCARLRAALDVPVFTTDIIVGFPGETEADFAETLQVARAAGFAKIHIFSYSPRAGTPAAALPDATPPQVIAERRARLLELEQDLAGSYARTLIGRRLQALVEGADPHRPGHVIGTSCRYLPISFRGHAAALIGRLAPVRVTGNTGSTLLGDPVADHAIPPRVNGSLFRMTLPVV
jgi:threonylcarbamoyladenosine tRNA methylthiotransferase MtaB